MLSVCPTNFPVRFPERGSQSLMTRSGPPEAMKDPAASVAIAYTEALVLDSSGGLMVMIGS